MQKGAVTMSTAKRRKKRGVSRKYSKVWDRYRRLGLPRPKRKNPRTKPKYKLRIINPVDIKPGDRLAAGFGVFTVKSILIDGHYVTINWQENQPSVKFHRSNWPEIAY